MNAQDLADDIMGLMAAGELMTFQIRPVTAFQLVSMLQLALRHPSIGDFNRRAGEELVGDIQGWFREQQADCIVEAIEEGKDPANDKPGFARCPECGNLAMNPLPPCRACGRE